MRGLRLGSEVAEQLLTVVNHTVRPRQSQEPVAETGVRPGDLHWVACSTDVKGNAGLGRGQVEAFSLRIDNNWAVAASLTVAVRIAQLAWLTRIWTGSPPPPPVVLCVMAACGPFC